MKAKATKSKRKSKAVSKPVAATALVLGQPASAAPAKGKQKTLPPWLIKAKKKQGKVRKQG